MKRSVHCKNAARLPVLWEMITNVQPHLREECRAAWYQKRPGWHGARSGGALWRPSSGPSGGGHPAPGGRDSSPSAAWTATPIIIIFNYIFKIDYVSIKK